MSLFLLLEVDGPGGADLLAHPALLPLEPNARVAIDDGYARHGLRERRVDCLAVAHPGLKHLVHHFARALLDADPAPGALVVDDRAGLLADLHLEAPHRAADFLQLGVGQERDVGVLPGLRHLGREDARGTVQRRESLVELGHVPADRRLAFDEVDGIARVSQLQRCLEARDTPADHERGLVHADEHRFQRLLVLHPTHSGCDERLDLLGRECSILGHPRDMLADVGHVEEVRVHACVLTSTAERLFVQMGRAGGHHHTGQVLFLDVLLDHRLPERGAHELIVPRDGDIREVRAGPLGNLFDIHHPRDIAAAVAHVNADFLGHNQSPLV